MQNSCDIGIIGMAVMGQNLALNIARKGFKVAVFNRTASRTEELMKRVREEEIVPTYNLKEFVNSLKRPRKVMLMVKAGPAVDEFIDKLLELLEPGDLIIDGGNSFYQDTERRIKEVEERGLLFLGTGISGGEYGALHGPSIMPGGHQEGYALVREIFEKVAAQVEDGPCCTYLGPRSAGHFVKMVHNGIEYAFMQAIAEAYDLLCKVYRLSSEEIGRVFEEFNRSEIASYLIEITAAIFKTKDPETQKPLVELILDQAEQKGTGKWTSQTAFDFGVPTPVINQSVIARTISSFKKERVHFASLWKNHEISPVDFDDQHKEKIKDALFVSMIAAFSEGLHLLKVASQEMQYGLNLSEVVRIWKGGCILRARILGQIQEALQKGEEEILLFSPSFLDEIKKRVSKLREIVALAIEKEIPIPVLNSSLTYLDSWKSENLPANLIQAQRDFFGAHTYRRIDKEGVFHTIWEE